MFIAQTLSETWFDDEAQHHRTQVFTQIAQDLDIPYQTLVSH